MMGTLFQGFMLAIAITAPIGAQNAWVMKCGMQRNHHVSAALICWLCNMTLIGVGIFGRLPQANGQTSFVTLLSIAGAIFLVSYAISCLKSAYRTAGVDGKGDPSAENAMSRIAHPAVIAGTLAVTLLNPHVYIDTIVILGSIANEAHADTRVLFFVGALTGSLSWFLFLALTAARMSSILSRRTVRIGMDCCFGVMMLLIAMSLIRSIDLHGPIVSVLPLN